jgi:hypothetical protein
LKRVLSIFGLVVLVCSLHGCGVLIKSDPIETLADQGRQEDLKNKALKEEAERFEKVLGALKSGAIQKGALSGEIEKSYGAPVVVIPKDEGQSWLYNAKGRRWFKQPKIYLYFDREKKLKKWECSYTDCGPA